MACATNTGHDLEDDDSVSLTFFSYAQKIDSSLHPDLLEMLNYVRMFSAFAQAFGQDEIIPVGSCVDGSKVRTPGDGGDVDVLLMPVNLVLDQSQFEYDERYPAFLKVLVTKENERYFHGLELVDGKYLPVSTLKELKSRFYSFVKLFVKSKSNTGVSMEEKYLLIVRQTAVGHEHVKLDFEPLKKFGFKRKHSIINATYLFQGCVGRFLHNFLDNIEKEDEDECTSDNVFKDPSSSKNTDLLQAINRFILYVNDNDDLSIDGNCKTADENSCTSNENKQELHSEENICNEDLGKKKDFKNHSASDIANKKQYEKVLYRRAATAQVNCDDNISEFTNLPQENKRITTDGKHSTYTSSMQSNSSTRKNDAPETPLSYVSNQSLQNVTEWKKDENESPTTTKELVGYIVHGDSEGTLKHFSGCVKTNEAVENMDAETVDPGCSHYCHELQQLYMVDRLLSTDFVPAFKFEGWPNVANEWQSRQRLWPPADVVQRILKTGCQIVAKRPLFPSLNGDPKKEDHSPEHDRQDTYFRLSFSRCELELSKSLNEFQLLVWRTLKAYQKAFLGTTPRVLASYHWKNVAFWVFEETSDDFWTERNVMAGVCKALDFMLFFLQLKFVPFYFVRTCNLIDGCRDDKIQEVFEKIQILRKNPLAFLKGFLTNPPCAEQQVVEFEKKDDCIDEEHSDENTFDDFFNIMSSFPDYCKHESFRNAMPYGVRNILKTMQDIANERSQPINSAGMSFLKNLEQVINSFPGEEASCDFNKIKKNLQNSIDTLTSSSKEENKDEVEIFSDSLKTIVDILDDGTDEADDKIRETMKKAGSSILTLVKRSSERAKTNEDNNMGTNSNPAEQVIDSLQNIVSSLFNSEVEDEGRNLFSNFLKSVADMKPSNPQQSDHSEKQGMDIDLD